MPGDTNSHLKNSQTERYIEQDGCEGFYVRQKKEAITVN